MTPTFTTYMLGPLVENYYRRYPGVKLLIQDQQFHSGVASIVVFHQRSQHIGGEGRRHGNAEFARMETMLLQDELDVGIAFDESRSRDIVVHPLLTETRSAPGWQTRCSVKSAAARRAPAAGARSLWPEDDCDPGVKLLIQEMNQERMETMLLQDELDVGIAFDESRKAMPTSSSSCSNIVSMRSWFIS
jgi:DNA-binding transcriptional LysR family regulator